ncbi:lantibiotic dehydratase [Streptomyces huiliensis]|uniref:lantibiotic dehydratase n=1 Tax=Streptomyces huiliensis TaxID=2876027 RepID=UPI0027E06F0E|nr:lantibiotic dehydratase [Streptomyces huiliensis]MBZ4319935.1 lantibiotic dehydratase family protein [Streptomyces huiliensis]
MTTPGARWELHPHFILRGTGFPFAPLDSVSFPETSDRIDALLDAEEALKAAADAAVARLRPREAVTDGRLRRRLWKSLSRLRPLPEDEELDGLEAPARSLLDAYRTAHHRRERAEDEARRVFGRELPARRSALHRLAGDERFREAVWLSSPQMYERGLRRYLATAPDTPRTGPVRSLERQVAGYLQRFCAKNETASFFGPINYGDFAEPGDEVPRAGGVTRRHAYVAYWVIRALADVIAADPQVQPYLRPRLSPLVRFDAAGPTLTLPDDRVVEAHGPAAAVLPLLDGKRTVADLARESGLDETDVLTELRHLTGQRLTLLGVDLPVTEPRALEALQEWVDALPGSCSSRAPWQRRLGALHARQEEFARAGFDRRRELLAELEEEVVRLTGHAARRSGGQLYADRLVVTEECLGEATPLHLGGEVLAAFTRELAPVLDLLAAEAVARHGELTEAVLDFVPALRDGRRLPLVRYLARPWQRLAEPEPGPRPWRAPIESRLAADPSGPVRLEASDVPVDERLLLGRALLCSPDVMLVADSLEAVRAGDFTLVLAESHDTMLLWGWALQFLASPEAGRQAGAELLSRLDTDHPLANMLTSKRAKIVPFEFPGPTLEAAQPSSRRDGETIPVGEVAVGREDGRLLLHAGRREGLLLYNGELESAAHNVLSPPRVRPVAFGGPDRRHVPRITVGRTVVQRESWRVAREELHDPAYDRLPGEDQAFALLCAVRRLARTHRLPRWVFAKIPGERKPVLLDTQGLFLTELLLHLSEPGAELTLSEMLPGPDELWLTGPGGGYCAELRLSAVRVREPRC